MRNVVLDSYAVLSFLFQEPGHETVFALFEEALDGQVSIVIAAPNWAEVRYMVERKAGKDQWPGVRDKLLGLPLEIIPAGRDLAEAAVEIKATHKMSLADCFAAALAKQQKAQLYTGDPEFLAIEKEVKVVWI